MRLNNAFSRILVVLVALGAPGALAVAASARSAAPPTVAGVPTLQGQTANPFVGDKLTVTNGQWNGSPQTFTYQWDRCDPTGDRQNCVPIAGATMSSYTVATADINHTLRARVTATNA